MQFFDLKRKCYKWKDISVSLPVWVCVCDVNLPLSSKAEWIDEAFSFDDKMKENEKIWLMNTCCLTMKQIHPSVVLWLMHCICAGA